MKAITGMNPKVSHGARERQVASSGLSFPQQAAGNQTYCFSPSRQRRAGA